MDLIRHGEFTLHSGGRSNILIDCSVISDRTLEVLAEECAKLLSFGSVEGVPYGGLRFARALEPYGGQDGGLLIVDDVLTTGRSMEEQRRGRQAQGLVLFARGPLPEWVHAVFTANLF